MVPQPRPSSRSLRLTVLGSLLLMVPAAAQGGGAKVEEQIVAPNEQGLSYYVSPKGAHVAAIVSKGSRFAVSFDGVVGPAFDVIMRPGQAIAFSPDGSRFAYAARAGADWVVMVDGKEAARGPIGQNHALAGNGGFDLRFTPNGKHWLFELSNNSGPPQQNRVYWDGVAGPPGGQAPVTVSPDGNRHAYVATVAGQGTLIVDGKPAPGIGGVPQFSADGAHLFTTRDFAVQGKPAQEILVDGRPMMRVQQATLYLPPAGTQVVAKVMRSDPNGMGAYFLVSGGKKVEGSDATGFKGVWFSGDGAHWAAVATAGRRERVIVDGKLHQEYDGIDSVAFAPDGKAVYAARSGPKLFAVVGGVETEMGFNMAPIDFKFSKTGRVGWIAGSDQSMVIMVDGKATRADGRSDVSDLSFSPDGSRFAYYVGAIGSHVGGGIRIDGVAGPGSSLTSFNAMRPGVKDPTRFIWSPDGKHAVHYGTPVSQSTRDYGWVVGGKYLSVGPAPWVALPTFTPDAKHLFWLAMDGNTETLRVYLDGRPVFEGDARGIEPLRHKEAWDMGEDGVLTFVVQTVEGFKRVRIVPGPENGFEAYMATGKALR